MQLFPEFAEVVGGTYKTAQGIDPAVAVGHAGVLDRNAVPQRHVGDDKPAHVLRQVAWRADQLPGEIEGQVSFRERFVAGLAGNGAQ